MNYTEKRFVMYVEKANAPSFYDATFYDRKLNIQYPKNIIPYEFGTTTKSINDMMCNVEQVGAETEYKRFYYTRNWFVFWKKVFLLEFDWIKVPDSIIEEMEEQRKRDDEWIQSASCADD